MVRQFVSLVNRWERLRRGGKWIKDRTYPLRWMSDVMMIVVMVMALVIIVQLLRLFNIRLADRGGCRGGKGLSPTGSNFRSCQICLRI